jgi:hypothetical protein
MFMGLSLVVLAGCQSVPRGAPQPRPVLEDPAPGVTMGCGIRGRVIDSYGRPRVFTRIASMPLDSSEKLVMTSDHEGRIALPADCRRLYVVGGKTTTGVAMGLVWIGDGAVDVELQLPGRGDAIYVRPEHVTTATRQRVLDLVTPTLLRPEEREDDRCAARTNELRRLRSEPEDATSRHLASVALMETECSPCPGDDAAVELIGALTEDQGLAEAWPLGYGRLYGCRFGPHPFEAKFLDVVERLDPEIAARVVFARYLEAEAQLDWDNADRLARMLREGRLANTEFAAAVVVAGDRDAP